jgi:hypothetical protein
MAFSTYQYQLLPSIRLLCGLSAVPQAGSNNIELHTDDLRIYDTLEESSRKLEAAMKLFAKLGKSKAAQEANSENGE